MAFPILFGFVVRCKAILCIHTTEQENFYWVSIKRLLPLTERKADLCKTLEYELKALFLLRVIQKIVLDFLFQYLFAQWLHCRGSTTAPPHY